MHIEIKFTKVVQTQPNNVSVQITTGNIWFQYNTTFSSRIQSGN